MGEFFKGWRRRTGCVTLMMACVVAGGWIRSLSHADEIRIPSHDLLRSVKGGLFWGKLTATRIHLKKQFNYDSYALQDRDNFEPAENRKRGVLGFGVSEYGETLDYDKDGRWSIHTTYWRVPYCAIVIPLTLISAWFVLWKPSESGHKKTVEPAPANGT